MKAAIILCGLVLGLGLGCAAGDKQRGPLLAAGAGTAGSTAGVAGSAGMAGVAGMAEDPGSCIVSYPTYTATATPIPPADAWDVCAERVCLIPEIEAAHACGFRYPSGAWANDAEEPNNAVSLVTAGDALTTEDPGSSGGSGVWCCTSPGLVWELRPDQNFESATEAAEACQVDGHRLCYNFEVLGYFYESCNYGWVRGWTGATAAPDQTQYLIRPGSPNVCTYDLGLPYDQDYLVVGAYCCLP